MNYKSPLNVPEYDDVITKIGSDNLISNLNPIELFIYDWLPDDVIESEQMRNQLQKVNRGNKMKPAYRVSSYYDPEREGYIGRIRVYEPWIDPENHDSIHERFLWGETTNIVRLTPQDAQNDAKMIGYNLSRS